MALSPIFQLGLVAWSQRLSKNWNQIVLSPSTACKILEYRRLWLISTCAYKCNVVSKYAPNRGYALNKGCNESHALLAGMNIRGRSLDSFTHLASIDVKSEGSILLEGAVTHSHCVFKEICGAVRVVWEKFYWT